MDMPAVAQGVGIRSAAALRPNTADKDRLLVSRADAARILALSVGEVDRLRRAGKLLAKKHGSRVLFPMSELRRYADSLPWADF
jgi:hypothetical protein